MTQEALLMVDRGAWIKLLTFTMDLVMSKLNLYVNDVQDKKMDMYYVMYPILLEEEWPITKTVDLKQNISTS